MSNKKGKFKAANQRDKFLNLRISQDEIDLIDTLCQARKDNESKFCSRIDVIMLAIKFSSGNLTLLDRMEMNLLEGKSLFDGANYPNDRYGDFLKKIV